MIDLSCHFLHGPECGPASFTESLELCRAAGENGVRTMVMTPRWKVDCPEPPLPFTECVERIALLQEALDRSAQVKFGFVLPYSARLRQLVDRHGSAVALNGSRHLLVSLPANNVPANAEEVWADLTASGFVVVVSQPESRPALRRCPEKIRAWVDKGVKLQISAASVLGWHGREVRRAALDYLQGYPDHGFIASNGHAGNGDAGALKQAHEELTPACGEAQARKWLNEIPAEILGKREMSRTAKAQTFAPRFSFFRGFSW